jgi:1,4-dihydroxy-2-naphthoate octaprenyltransferase
VGWPILVFAIAGGLAAIFYEAPPIRWSYRGLGELVIALSYGPWMVLGSLYLHAKAAVLAASPLRSCPRASSWRSPS